MLSPTSQVQYSYQPIWQGTWQFLSLRLVQDRTLIQGLLDDLESSFWVLVYLILRYHPIACRKTGPLRSMFDHVFGHHRYEENESEEGVYADSSGLGKSYFILGGYLSKVGLDASVAKHGLYKPLANFIKDVPCNLKALYSEDSRERLPREQAIEHFSSHAYFLGKLKGIVEQDSWPVNDAVTDRLQSQLDRF